MLSSFLTTTTLKEEGRGKVGSGKHAFAPSGGWMKKCTTHFGEKEEEEEKRAMEGHEDKWSPRTPGGSLQQVAYSWSPWQLG